MSRNSVKRSGKGPGQFRSETVKQGEIGQNYRSVSIQNNLYRYGWPKFLFECKVAEIWEICIDTENLYRYRCFCIDTDLSVSIQMPKHFTSNVNKVQIRKSVSIQTNLYRYRSLFLAILCICIDTDGICIDTDSCFCPF